MADLFSPFAVGGLALANRIVVSPMCQYVAVDGLASDWHIQHYGSLAQSGAGLLIVEGTAVEPDGRITPGDLGLWDDATETALGKVVAVVKRRSPTMIGVQLAHAGRKGSSRVPWEGGAQLGTTDGGLLVEAPSALAHAPGEATPTALDVVGIRRIVDRFAEAARRAHRLGFDAIELHGAHGYLIHQFLSPIANARDDDYGGSAEKRLRFPLEVLDAVRAAFPGPVGMKLSVSEWVDGGLDLAQSIGIARALADRGAAWITASSGGISPAQRIPVGPGYQLPFAQGIRDAVGVPTIAVGLVTEPAEAEAIIADGQADLVALARGMLYDPRWGWHAAAKLGAKVEAAPSYWRAAPHDTDIFVETTNGAR